MFKVGDIVKMKTEFSCKIWYTNKSYTILKINKDVVTLDRCLNLPDYHTRQIHVDYLILEIKEIRKQKLQRLCSKSEIE